MYGAYGNIKTFIKRLNDRYGAEWYNWMPETLLYEIKDDFNLKLDEHEQNKLFAVRLILTNDSPYEDPFVFENTILALSDITPVMDTGQLLLLSPFIDAVKTMLSIRNHSLSLDVLKYIAAIFYVNDAYYIPLGMGEISRAQQFLKRLLYEKGESELYDNAEKMFKEKKMSKDDTYKLYKLYENWSK